VKCDVLYPGTSRTIKALLSGRGKVFYEEDLGSTVTDETIERIDDMIQYLGDTPNPFVNLQNVRKVNGYTNLYEAKPHDYRILFSVLGGNFLVLSAFKKCPLKEQRRQFATAHGRMQQYLRNPE